MQLREYLGFLLELLSRNPYIKNQNINLEERAPDAGIIKGIITFIDDSSLHLKEFLIVRPNGVDVLKYGYHYATRGKDLIFRYDNAADPEAKSFSTYPSHKHTPKGMKKADRPNVKQLLDEISEKISLNLLPGY
ncbi:MAG: DUF6516 family protein [Deltaproteobacteria bacterium]|nr:DUF6516 family protein [Deltaproteobacteria bacterium]